MHQRAVNPARSDLTGPVVLSATIKAHPCCVERASSTGQTVATPASPQASFYNATIARHGLSGSLVSSPGVRFFFCAKDSFARQAVTSRLTHPTAASASLHSVHPGLLHMLAGRRLGQLIG